MAEEQFYTILTNIGKAKIANATLLNSNLTLKTLKVGDGNGTYYNPTEDQEDLKNTVHECAIGAIYIDKKNPNWIISETIIPGSVGGFTIREVGLFDAEGDMIAVGKYPETYKPVVANGASKDLNVRTIFEVSNAENVTLNLDPSVIIATKEDVNNLQEQIEENTTQLNDLANPSLLINGDFRNPVNQRRKSSYNVNGEYTIDRWRFINDNNGTMTINDGYISISNGVANNTYLQYNYDTDMKVLEGEKVTFTIVYKSTATYRLSSFIGSAEEDVNIYLTPIDDWTVKTLTLDLSSWKYSIGKVESSIILQSYDGSSFTNGTLDVKYIKLELGSVATPFIPRLYGEELALCQRYYEEVPAGQQVLGVKDNVNAFIYWNFIVEKRINPTVSFTHPGYDNNHVNAYSNNIELANTPVEIEWTNKRTARMKIPALSSVPIGSAISAFGAITINAEIY
ncbi:phage tail protein [Clostridium sp.]|uniref:phage tail protein n=1 Tax=Clostridium sp. TaxID=1506 RepID=UPI001DF8F545|nr:phage tail protein [Clostridium sp.]MBS4783947.1 phage tail protein [Clostridium sp.]